MRTEAPVARIECPPGPDPIEGKCVQASFHAENVPSWSTSLLLKEPFGTNELSIRDAVSVVQSLAETKPVPGYGFSRERRSPLSGLRASTQRRIDFRIWASRTTPP